MYLAFFSFLKAVDRYVISYVVALLSMVASSLRPGCLSSAISAAVKVRV